MTGIYTTEPPAEIAIQIDDRERASGLVEILNARQSFPVTVTRLPVGDVSVGGIYIERKTVRDFQVSLLDGRLFRQVTRLRSVCGRCLLVIEADRDEGSDFIHLHAARGALLEVTAGWQVPYMLCCPGLSGNSGTKCYL